MISENNSRPNDISQIAFSEIAKHENSKENFYDVTRHFVFCW